MKNKYYLFLLTGIVLTTCITTAEYSDDEIKHFNVMGTKILDPDGKEFLIKGVNVNGPGWVFPRDTLQDIPLITDIWQFNTVRMCAAIGWEWARENNKNLNALINAFTSKGIVVILEVHDYTGIYPPQNKNGYRAEPYKYIHPLSVLKKWWVDKAKRYGNNPYVWFNIMNEPGSEGSQSSAELWYNIHSEIIEAIRGAKARNIIVLDDHNWGQAGGYFYRTSPYDSAVIKMGPVLNEKFENLVFSLHIYDAWRDGELRLNRYLSDAHDLKLCVIIGEFGVVQGNVALVNSVKVMYDNAIPKNIGRLYWAWDDAGLPLTVNGCGWQINKNDGQMPDNLTWAGEMVWLDNRGLLEAPLPRNNFPVSFTCDFENSLPGGWVNWSDNSVMGGVSHNSSKALVIKKDAQGGAGCPIELLSGTTYTFSAWGMNSGGTSSSADVGIKYRLDENDPEEQHIFISFTENKWVRKSVKFTTPDVMYGTSLFIWKPDASVAFYIDDIEIIPAN
ncbi:MAG: cellulase family glycosylhydrolase [Treponema sp.]|jgi:hypothetical protein|nr:cellulase family glycosylhydrolase [Treponema sp.]